MSHKSTGIEIELTAKDLEVAEHIARKKGISLQRYLAQSAAASLTADVDELYDAKSPMYGRLMKKLGLKAFS